MPRSLREAFTYMRRTPSGSWGYFSIVHHIFVAYVFSFLLYGSEIIIRYFETRPQVTAFLSRRRKISK